MTFSISQGSFGQCRGWEWFAGVPEVRVLELCAQQGIVEVGEPLGDGV